MSNIIAWVIFFAIVGLILTAIFAQVWDDAKEIGAEQQRRKDFRETNHWKRKAQIAACHGKGMTLSEISARSGLVEDVVAEFLESIGKTPNRSERRKITRLTQEQKKRIGELFSQGKGCTEISKSTGINIKTIEYYKKKLRKEKEPESAATDTSSVGCIKKTDGDTVSLSKDTTIEAKCQVLSPFTALTLLEALLDNWVGNEYEKYYMQAYEGDAEFIFIHEGRKYSFQFKECKEDSGE